MQFFLAVYLPNAQIILPRAGNEEILCEIEESEENQTQDTLLMQPVLCHWATTTRRPSSPHIPPHILHRWCWFWLTPNWALTAHARWLPGVWLRYFSTTCAVHIEDCEGWTPEGGCPAVIAQWQSAGSTSQVSWVRFPTAAGLFTFLYLGSYYLKSL